MIVGIRVSPKQIISNNQYKEIDLDTYNKLTKKHIKYLKHQNEQKKLLKTEIKKIICLVFYTVRLYIDHFRLYLISPLFRA